MKTTTIRPALAGDAETVTAIYNHCLAERSATFETRPRRVEEIAERIADTHYPLLVAEDADGKVLGWAGLSSYRPRDCYSGIAEFSIYLDSAARGRGVGRILLAALVDAARERGYWKLLSRIFTFNLASRLLCKSCGFREVGVYERHGQLDGRWLDVVIVEQLLGEPPAQPSARSRARYLRADELAMVPDVPGSRLWAIALDKTMFTRFEVDAHARFEMHEHASEQITHVLSGALYFDVDGQTQRVGPGDVIAIPAHVPHAVYTQTEPAVAVDAWSPVMPGYGRAADTP
jgi:L-amino acid N-acyltransferase YncA/mannose-6-phosphate isomerase-like protein (cupin superfamily)